MVVKIASYNDGTSSYNTEVEETKWTDYRIIARLNECAEAVITLADPTGSIMRKYNVDANDVFIGPGRLTIEKPAATDIFDGRILKAVGDSGSATVRLLCKDWLSQLEDPIITKDMREDLDGSGLRQSEIKANLEALTTFTGIGDITSPLYTSGADYYMFDDAMSWDIEGFDGYYVVLPLDHVGEQIITIGPFAEDLLGATTRTGGFRNMWEHDDDVCVYTHAAGVAGSEGEFRLFANEGSLGAKATAITCTMTYQYYNGSGDGIFYYWDATGAGARVAIDTVIMGADANAPYRTLSVTLTPDQVAKAQVDDDGLIKFEFWTAAVGGETPIINVNKWNITATVNVASGHSALIIIEDTRKTGDEAFDDARMYEAGVGYTDETVDINDKVGAQDVTFFPDPLSRNDVFYFGHNNQFNEIKLAITVAGNHAGTFIWQYWDGNSWESLSSVNDGTSGFKGTAGHKTVSWTLPSDWATTTVDGQTHYFVRAWQATIAPAVVTQAKGDYGYVVNGAGNILEVDTDLSMTGLGLWECCPYSIVQPVYKHIDTAEGGTLVSDHDPLVTLTAAAGIEHTSGVSTRRYENHVPLVILQDLADIDKVAFYVPIGTTALTWKSTFNDGAPTAMTDASVNKWGFEYSFVDVHNGFILFGPMINDNVMKLDTKDIAGGDPGADSKSTYGVSRYKVERKAGVCSEYDLSALGSALVERDEDVLLFLNCDIAGLSALRLGDEVSITSTYMGLTAAKYVITYWEYSYSENITKLRLHPRLSTKGFVQHRVFAESIRQQQNALELIAADVDYLPAETST